MKSIITDESWRPTTALNQPLPPSIAQVHSFKNSKAAFMLLLNDGHRNHYTLGTQFSIPDDLETPMYRVAFETELPLTTNFVEYYLGKDDVAYADKLLSEASHTYPGNQWAPIYVEIPVSQMVKMGNYPVKIKIYQSSLTGAEVLVAEKEVQIMVADFALTPEPTKDFHLDVWQQPSNLARTFHVPMWGDQHFALIDEMAEKLAQIGQKTVTVIAGEIPWKGWFNYIVKDYPANLYEYSMVQVSKDSTGKLKCDFTILDRYLASFAKRGIDQEIEIFGLLGVWKPPFFPQVTIKDYPENLVVRYLDETTETMQFIDNVADLTNYVKALCDHLKDLQVWEKVRLIADEPKQAQLKEFKDALSALKQMVPDLKVKIAFDKEPILNELAPLVDTLATSFYCTSQFGSQLQASHPGEVQYYICNYPDHPNTFLHSPLLEARLQGTLTAFLPVNGLLRWAFNCWPSNAREDIRYNTSSLPIGDNCLVYPGENGHLLLSLRYKQLERAVEDFSLIKSAKAVDEKRTTAILEHFLGETAPQKWMEDSHCAAPKLFRQTANDFKQMRDELVAVINNDV